MRLLAALAASVMLSAAAASAAPTVTDLVEIAEVSGVSVSPDRRLAVVREDRASVAGNDYALTWWVVDTTGARPPLRIGGAGAPTFTQAGTLEPQKAQWSADSQWFYYRALLDGAVQVWRGRADGSAVEQITHDAADVIEFRLDPATLAVTYMTGEPREAIIAAERAEYDGGIVVDQSVDPGQSIFRGMLINGRMATERLTGEWFSRRGLLDKLPAHERRIAADGKLEVLGRKPRPQGRRPAEPGAEAHAVTNAAGATAFATGYDDPPIFLRTPAGGPAAKCQAPACQLRRVYELTWTSDGQDLVIHGGNAAREHVLVLWNPASGRARTLVAYDGVLGSNQYDFPDCDLALTAIICAVEGPTEPGRLEAIELRRGTRTVLLDPNRDARGRVAMRTEPIRWSAGGYDFAGRLFLPEGGARGEPAPLFIQYYACEGYLRGGLGDEYPFAVLASHGIVALCISSTMPKHVTAKNHDALLTYDIGVQGIQAIVEKLAIRGLIDRRRIGMGGLSFGSEVTLRMLTTTDLLAAGSISSPQLEPIYYWYGRQSADFRQQIRQSWGIGSPDETPERWKQISEAANAHRINAPLLMQLPEQESRYNYELFGRIQMRNVPVEMIVFPEEPHIKFQPRHKAAVYERNVDWFRFWLKDEVDPAPSKKAQYDRWRAMASAWRKAGAHPGGAGGPATD